ncbi:acyl-CoA thioesterase [Cupriavidus nantongensis]|uniref:4-hydroxybenzoyl-CoA thioesterase n=1 Tax=Cupriavidus nantongensis TaxID=1796606 RepID=A0A142JVA9_9BURK|nr:acyl-CoA thioesterase [Cupriavidus nantongensis]AMR82021.1 4-hydroxybenzoyl-CoA thioesterase [Cupriavidus nantongensis]
MKEVVYTIKVEFGDCDPAGIVWFPNFFRWIDASSQHFFLECGVPPWREMERTLGVIGTPLVDTRATFVNAASYGDTLRIHTSLTELRGKSFVQHHRVMRGGDLVMQCEEVRVFARRREDGGIAAVPVPPGIRAALG